MGKKKKKIAVNQNLIHDNSLYLDVDRYRLPQTLGNAPKIARQANDKAFEAIRPQLDTLIEDGSLCHSLKLSKTDIYFLCKTSSQVCAIEVHLFTPLYQFNESIGTCIYHIIVRTIGELL